MTTRLTVALPDDIGALVREAAGDNMSAFAARALRNELLRTRPGDDTDADEIALADEQERHAAEDEGQAGRAA